MPNSTQIRSDRIMKLYKLFDGKNITTIDSIYQKGCELFPLVSDETVMSYAKATLKMVKPKKKEGS